MYKGMEWFFVVLFFVCGVCLGVVAGASERPAPSPAPTYNAAHASACRALHAIALTRRETAEAVLACEHRSPDARLGAINERSVGR